jgi:hypothetical protein
MPETSLNKTLKRFVAGGELGTKADRFLSLYYDANPDTWKSDLVSTVKLYGMSALTGLVKTANAELTDDQAYSVARDVIRRVTGNASASPGWIGSEGDFNDMLSQVNAPAGGSEMLTNTASPGLHPAKTSAEPGRSGKGPTTSTHGTSEETVQQFTDRALNTAGRYSGTGHYAGYRQAPGAFVAGEGEGHNVLSTDGPQEPLSDFQGSSDNPHNRATLSHGPVGTAGDTDIVSVKPGQTKPGNVHPVYRETTIGYSKTGYGKGPSTVAKQVATSRDTFMIRAPRILQALAVGEATNPHIRSVTPKFSIEKGMLHVDPEAKYHVPELGGALPKNTVAKSERITKGILKSRKREDVRTGLPADEGVAYAGTERQRAFHTEEDYGDTGDASQYPEGSPTSDDPNALSDLNFYDEAKREEDEEEAGRQDEAARRSDEEAKKAYRNGQYQLADTLKQDALSRREIAVTLRRRHL